jgi:hypothetical protein
MYSGTSSSRHKAITIQPSWRLRNRFTKVSTPVIHGKTNNKSTRTESSLTRAHASRIPLAGSAAYPAVFSVCPSQNKNPKSGSTIRMRSCRTSRPLLKTMTGGAAARNKNRRDTTVNSCGERCSVTIVTHGAAGLRNLYTICTPRNSAPPTIDFAAGDMLSKIFPEARPRRNH